jgi:hypothetical protein
MRRHPLLLLCFLTGACADARPDPEWTVVDSAGVRITLSAEADVPETTPSELLLSLGTSDGGGPTDFYRVRDVEIVATSLVAVANELDWFRGALFPEDLSVPARTIAVTARYMTELVGTGLLVDTSLVSIYDDAGRLIETRASVSASRLRSRSRTVAASVSTISARRRGAAPGMASRYQPRCLRAMRRPSSRPWKRSIAS